MDLLEYHIPCIRHFLPECENGVICSQALKLIEVHLKERKKNEIIGGLNKLYIYCWSKYI